MFTCISEGSVEYCLVENSSGEMISLSVTRLLLDLALIFITGSLAVRPRRELINYYARRRKSANINIINNYYLALSP